MEVRFDTKCNGKPSKGLRTFQKDSSVTVYEQMWGRWSERRKTCWEAISEIQVRDDGGLDQCGGRWAREKGQVQDIFQLLCQIYSWTNQNNYTGKYRLRQKQYSSNSTSLEHSLLIFLSIIQFVYWQVQNCFGELFSKFYDLKFCQKIDINNLLTKFTSGIYGSLKQFKFTNMLY